jgi:hypothetical protein
MEGRRKVVFEKNALSCLNTTAACRDRETTGLRTAALA